MSLKKIGTAAVALALVTEVQVIAAQPHGNPPEVWQDVKPQTKVDTAPATAASLAGKWTIHVDTPAGARPFWIEMKVDPKDAKKVTGTIATMVSTDAIEGEVVAGQLTFWFSSVDPAGNTVRITFVGTVQKDKSLAGTLTFGQGSPMPWTATRDKK